MLMTPMARRGRKNVMVGVTCPSSETSRQRSDLPQWPDSDLLMHGIYMLSGVNDPQVMQAQIVQGNAHRAGDVL